MDKILKELTDLQETIAQTKKSVAQLEGRRDEILNQLKKEFKVASIAEAEKKLATLKKESTELENTIQKDFKKLKDEYEW